jgi:hypothetical protein
MSCARCLSSYRACTWLSWWQWQNLETRGSDLHKGRAQIDGACWPCQNQSTEKGVDSFLRNPLPPRTLCCMPSLLHALSLLYLSLSRSLALALALALSIYLHTCIMFSDPRGQMLASVRDRYSMNTIPPNPQRTTHTTQVLATSSAMSQGAIRERIRNYGSMFTDYISGFLSNKEIEPFCDVEEDEEEEEDAPLYFICECVFHTIQQRAHAPVSQHVLCAKCCFHVCHVCHCPFLVFSCVRAENERWRERERARERAKRAYSRGRGDAWAGDVVTDSIQAALLDTPANTYTHVIETQPHMLDTVHTDTHVNQIQPHMMSTKYNHTCQPNTTTHVNQIQPHMLDTVRTSSKQNHQPPVRTYTTAVSSTWLVWHTAKAPSKAPTFPNPTPGAVSTYHIICINVCVCVCVCII